MKNKKKNINVLVFSTLYPNNIWPNHGVFVKERMTHFAKMDGCRIKVVAPVPYFPRIKFSFRYLYSKVLKHELVNGVDIYHPRYFMIPKIGMPSYGVFMFLSVLRLVKKLNKEFDFDIIDAHYIYPDGFAAVLLGMFLKRPVVVSARGSDIHHFSKLPTIKRFLIYTLGKAAHVISVSKALKDEMIKLGIPDNKIAVIPNGVDVEKFYPVPKNEARRKLGLSNEKIILSVGRLIPLKGFDLLIKAVLESANDKDNKKSLYIIGEGEYRSELEKLISTYELSNNVKLIGEIPHKDLYLWYSASDLFCLASSREGWPNVLLEAMACGVPVVATDVWGMPEIIQTEDIGLLTRRNVDSIKQKISIALNKEWNNKDIIEYARNRGWNQTATSVYGIFHNVLNGKVSL